MSNTELLVKELVKQHGKTRNSLMAVLQGVVQEERFLSEDAMIAVARELGSGCCRCLRHSIILHLS
jgi:NADH-quinone oxidoreductase subunit E